MKTIDSRVLRHPANTCFVIQWLMISFSLLIVQDLQAQATIVCHTFSSGYESGAAGGLSMRSIVGQPFVGIQRSDNTVVASGFAAFDGTGGVVSEVPIIDESLPTTFGLSQNFPNPFNPATEIRYQISDVRSQTESNSFVRLSVFDVLGREVAVLVNEAKGPGRYTARWNANGMPSGVYLYRLETSAGIELKRMVLLK